MNTAISSNNGHDTSGDKGDSSRGDALSLLVDLLGNAMGDETESTGRAADAPAGTSLAAAAQRHPALQTALRPAPVPDVEALAHQVHRTAARQNGAVGAFRARLLGDPLQRRQLDDLRRRIEALSIGEREKLGVALFGAIRNAGYLTVTNTIEGMHQHRQRFAAESPAADVASFMIERNKANMPDLEDQVAQQAEGMIVEALGFNR